MADNFKVKRKQTNQSTLSLFDNLQPVLNQNIPEVAQKQKLDVEMFSQTVNAKRKVNVNKNAAQQMYGEQSRQVLQQNDVLQSEINTALTNPFYDISAFFSGDKSTDDLLNEQKGLAGKLNRIHRDNTSTTTMFDNQISVLNAELESQLGLTKLKAEQSKELESLIDRQTSISSAQKVFEDDKLEGFTINMLDLEIKDTNSKFSKGLLIKWKQIKQNEAIDNISKKRALKNGGKVPNKKDVLGYTGMDTLKSTVDMMTNLGQDSTVIDGLKASKADLVEEIDRKKTIFSKGAAALDSLNSDFVLASTLISTEQADADRLDISTLPQKNQSELLASKFLSDTFENMKASLLKQKAEGKQLNPNEIQKLQVVAREAVGMRERAMNNAAKIKADRFENEKANAAAKGYYKVGRFISSSGARDIMTELVLTESSDALAEESGVVIGGVVKEFADTYSEQMVSNFADNNSDRTQINSTPELRQLLFEQNKTNKLNPTVAWQRTINEQINVDKGEESNKWVSSLSNQLIAAQVHVGTQQFLSIPAVQNLPEISTLLTTSGGNVKPEFIGADVDTVGAMVQSLAIISSKLKIKGTIPEDIDLGALYLDQLKSDAILGIAKRELERPNIALQGMLRALYGNNANAASSYLGIYTEKLNSYDTVGNEAEVRVGVVESIRRNALKDQFTVTNRNELGGDNLGIR